jgi:hypothetical protein
MTTDYTKDEILEAIEESDYSQNEFWTECSNATLKLRGQEVTVRIEDSEGGSGEGERCMAVISVGSQFFKKEGYYASHYGYEWDGDFSEVEPYERTIRDWRNVK